jgi:hypothetical protein
MGGSKVNDDVVTSFESTEMGELRRFVGQWVQVSSELRSLLYFIGSLFNNWLAWGAYFMNGFTDLILLMTRD